MEVERRSFYQSFLFPFIYLIVLWGVKVFELRYGYDLSRFGIFPRTFMGLTGVAFAPLIHGDFNHLISNTFPLLILGIAMFYFYRTIAFEIFLWIYFLPNIWVWISAIGQGYHIGSSGIIYGAVSFLFFSGIFRKNQKSMILSLIIIFIYGSLVWGIFPFTRGVSWETHFFGSLSGGLAAYFYRKTGEEYLKSKEKEPEGHGNDSLIGGEHNES
jgi:membrane associated rhomboid family serine protease